MPKFLILKGRHKLGTFDLVGKEYILGRGDGVDIRVDNPLVSRRHARVSFFAGAWRIEDLDTPNGLYINGNRIRKHALLPGDRIELGQHLLIFQGPADSDIGISTLSGDHSIPAIADEQTVILPTPEVEIINRKNRQRLQTHLVISHRGQRQEVPLTKSTIRVGYSDDCEVRIPGGSMFAKQLLELRRRDDGEYAVLALSGLAPTKLNGERLSDTRRLKDKDQLLVRGVSLTYFRTLVKD